MSFRPCTYARTQQFLPPLWAAIKKRVLLDCPVYKDLKDNLFLGILETDEIDLSYGNNFEKLRILLTQGSLKSHELFGDYIRKVIKNVKLL